MAPKRPREEDGEARMSSKKQKKGFAVGPANLPDGTYKRKVQKIKKDLIHKAKLKQSYAKLKARDQPTTTRPSIYSREASPASPTSAPSPAPERTLEPHPDRQRLLDEPSPPPPTYAEKRERKKRPKPQPFKSETSLAQKRRQEAEARRKEREEAEKERQKRLAERERFRKQMAKARGRPGEKRKLGRESGVLLEKVKRMVGEA